MHSLAPCCATASVLRRGLQLSCCTCCGLQVKNLMEMGFDEASVRAALERNNMDQNRALDSLLGGA